MQATLPVLRAVRAAWRPARVTIKCDVSLLVAYNGRWTHTVDAGAYPVMTLPQCSKLKRARRWW